jgi:hypothetical protein
LLRGVSRNELTGFGKYRAVIQQPGEGSYGDAVFFDTYPPFEPTHSEEVVEQVKVEATEASPSRDLDIKQDTGSSGASGGEHHDQLLNEAKQYLEFEADAQVNLLHQNGSSKPDGHIIHEDGDIAHLEAEHTTLTKPERVLENLNRAVEQDRRCVFVVNEDRIDRLETILGDVDDDHYRLLAATDLGVTEHDT